MPGTGRSALSVLIVLTWMLSGSTLAPAQPQPPAAVMLSETDDVFTLDNGIVKAQIARGSGGLISLEYAKHELLAGDVRRPGGYWSHEPTGRQATSSISIDPKTNAGRRGEVSIKGTSEGDEIGRGPGGGAVADIEIRYSLGQGESGLYTYCIFDHRSAYPATSIGEARFALKLNRRVFDWMTIDPRRNRLMPTGKDWDAGTELNMKEARRLTTGVYAGQVEHKYDYSAVQFDTPAFGWSSTHDHVGLWIINPTIEYLSGGATKVELTGHLDGNPGGNPTLLNYWRGSHYGGSQCTIAAGEKWTKVIGPFLIYANASDTPDAMYSNAIAQAKIESAAWPYDWVTHADYPHKADRATVTGQIILNDPQAPEIHLSHLLVGLAAPDYASPTKVRDTPVDNGTVDWQRDAKHYEFWTRGADDGRFVIPNVRPGVYTLHAISDGVLGEFAQEKITVTAGQSLDLARLEWKPIRFGRQLWEIGIPNRTAEEFRHGDHYWQWGLYNDYPADFPDDVNFTIGKSDFHKDWNYAQVPRGRKPTTWSIHFTLSEIPQGKATLRLALAGNSARSIDVAVNGASAGSTGRLPDVAVIRRDGIRGYWFERDVPFDAKLMKAGDNVLQLTIPGANAMYGVEYDYLRLEVK